MKIDTLKHQVKTLSRKGTKQHSADQIDDTKTPIYRYIKLTYLIPDLLKLVDNSVLHDKRTYLTVGIKSAVELSYLTKDEQNLLYSTFIYDDLFNELLSKNYSYQELLVYIHYIVHRVISNKFRDEYGNTIENKLGYFKNSIICNINRLENLPDELYSELNNND